MMKKTTKLLTLSLLSSSLLLSTAAKAEDSQTIKFSHIFSSSHWLWEHSFKIFEDRIREETDGEVDFTNFHAGQLGKEATNVIRSGMADMVTFVPSYEPSKLPLTSVAELPGYYSTSCEGTEKLWEISKEGGELYESEYKPLGVKLLFVTALTPMELMTTEGNEITSLEDVEGMKIRANGTAMSKAARALGATPISVTTSETYDALSRGVIDGAIWNLASTREASLENLLKYTISNAQVGSGSVLYGIRMDTWNQMSEERQETFQRVAMEVQQEVCEFNDRRHERELKWLTEEAGLVVNELSEEDEQRWADRLSTVAEDWAAELDSSGRAGSEVLEAFGQASGK